MLEDPISFHEYVTAVHLAGMRHRAVRLFRAPAQDPPPDSIRAFTVLLRHVIADSDNFQLLFVDASSLHPHNFRRHLWVPKGGSATRWANTRYEGLTLVAALSRNRLFAAQFLRGGTTAAVFSSFLRQVLGFAREEEHERRHIVMLLDIATCQYSLALARMCAAYGATLFHSLPGFCRLNAIEALWAHIKAPLRA